MSYPANITSLGNGWDLGNSPNGDKIFEYAGNLFLFIRQGGTGGTPSGDVKIHAMKSIDRGLTWAEADSANLPAFNTNISAGLHNYTVMQDGATAYIMTSTTSAPTTVTGLQWATFDLGLSTWGSLVTSSSIIPDEVASTGGEVLLHLIRRGSSDYILFYSGTRETVSAVERGRCYYATFNGSAFGSATAITGQAGQAQTYFPNSGKSDSTGKIQFIYSDRGPGASSNNFNVYAITLGPTNILGTPTLITQSAYIIGEQGQVSRLEVYMNGAIETLGVAIVLWNDATGFPSIGYFDAPASTNPTWNSHTVFTGAHNDPNADLIVTEDVDYYVIPQHITLAAANGKIEIIGLDGDQNFDAPAGYWETHADTSDPTTWSAKAHLFDVSIADSNGCQVTAIGLTDGVGIFGSGIDSFTNEEVGQFYLVSVAAPGTPAPTCSLSSDKTSIFAGQTVILSWTTTNTPTSASIDNGVGAVPVPTGAISVSPIVTTTYILTVTNAGGSSTCQVTITVGDCASSASRLDYSFFV